jgi:hypothetical protein
MVLFDEISIPLYNFAMETITNWPKSLKKAVAKCSSKCMEIKKSLLCR